MNKRECCQLTMKTCPIFPHESHSTKSFTHKHAFKNMYIHVHDYQVDDLQSNIKIHLGTRKSSRTMNIHVGLERQTNTDSPSGAGLDF